MEKYETKANLMTKTSNMISRIMELEYFCLDCFGYTETDSLAREIKAILSKTSNDLLEIVRKEKRKLNANDNS